MSVTYSNNNKNLITFEELDFCENKWHMFLKVLNIAILYNTLRGVTLIEVWY